MLPPLGSAKATDFIKDVQVFIRDNADRPVIYHIFRYNCQLNDSTERTLQ